MSHCLSLLDQTSNSGSKSVYWWKIYGISKLNWCQCRQSWQLFDLVWQVWQLSLGLLLLLFWCYVVPGWCWCYPASWFCGWVEAQAEAGPAWGLSSCWLLGSWAWGELDAWCLVGYVTDWARLHSTLAACAPAPLAHMARPEMGLGWVLCLKLDFSSFFQKLSKKVPNFHKTFQCSWKCSLNSHPVDTNMVNCGNKWNILQH